MRPKIEKNVKNAPTWPQDPPKRRGIKKTPAYAMAPLAPIPELKFNNNSVKINKHEFKRILVQDFPRWGEDPRALRPLRGDRRIPFGFRHAPLEAASMESSGV